MCGIVGIRRHHPVAPLLVDALKRLEYRGYDSAGVATRRGRQLDRRRAEGKLRQSRAPPARRAARRHHRHRPHALGHAWRARTRPTPIRISTGSVAVVHNGIIENFRELRGELDRRRRTSSTSQTDTEVVAQLVPQELEARLRPRAAVAARAEAAAAAPLRSPSCSRGEDDLLIGARHGPPLAVGHGDGRDVSSAPTRIALAPFTDTITYLEDGDWVVLTRARCADLRRRRATR